MADVILRPLTVANWAACANLQLAPDQVTFIPSNLHSIAQAQFYPDSRSRAVYRADGVLVGYAQYGIDDQTGRWKIFRLMIDHAHQGRGYGRAALAQMIADIRAVPYDGEIILRYRNNNDVARRLYASAGFVEQSISDEGEVNAVLQN